MSTGTTSEAGILHNDVFRKTVITLAISLGLTAAAYFLFVRPLLYASAGSGQNPHQQQTGDPKKSGEEDKKGLAAIREELQSLISRLQQLEKNPDGQDPVLPRAANLEAERARNRNRIVEAYGIGQDSEVELQQLEKDISQWQGAVQSATNEKSTIGKKIATSASLVEQFAILTTTPIATFADHKRWEDRLKALYTRIKSAHQDPKSPAVVGAEDISALKTLGTEVKTARAVLRQHQRSLNVLVATAKNNDPGSLTLQQTLDAHRAKQDAAYAQKLAKARSKAADAVDADYIEKLAAEYGKQRELLNQQKLKAAQQKTQVQKAELARIADSLAKLQAQKEREQLLRDFDRDLPTIKTLLMPFLARGITQPTARDPISRSAGGPPRPMSLGALRGTIALQDSQKGLDFLWRVGGSSSLRPRGGFPAYSLRGPTTTSRAQVRRAQQLLNKYGDLLVEKEMLSP